MSSCIFVKTSRDYFFSVRDTICGGGNNSSFKKKFKKVPLMDSLQVFFFPSLSSAPSRFSSMAVDEDAQLSWTCYASHFMLNSANSRCRGRGWSRIDFYTQCQYFKGTVHPQNQQYVFFLLSVLLFIHLYGFCAEFWRYSQCHFSEIMTYLSRIINTSCCAQFKVCAHDSAGYKH